MKAESQVGVADLSTADQEASHDGDNKFQKAISAWRSEYRTRFFLIGDRLIQPDIDLTSMIPTLDNTASEIVQYQRDSTIQRKDLAQKTKDFRKLDDTSKLVEVKTLLKGTQCAWKTMA